MDQRIMGQQIMWIRYSEIVQDILLIFAILLNIYIYVYVYICFVFVIYYDLQVHFAQGCYRFQYKSR